MVLDLGEEDLRFIVCGLAKGYDPNLVIRLGVCNRDRDALQQAQGHESALTVCEAVVLIGERQAREDCLGIDKVQSMIPEVGLALALIPAVSHLQSVYTRLGDGNWPRLPDNWIMRWFRSLYAEYLDKDVA